MYIGLGLGLGLGLGYVRAENGVPFESLDYLRCLQIP